MRDFKVIIAIFLATLTVCTSAGAQTISSIAKSIQILQPNLSNAKAREYATGILKASRRYHIDPGLLVAIAHTETAFREDLPIGKAGEIGICQILRSWNNNRYFRKEFPTAKEQDFWNPEKNFLFAAWLLNDLKKTRRSRSIPYWSYYNAVSFEPRLKYFLAVNRRLYKIDYYGDGVRQAGDEPLVPLRADAVQPERAIARVEKPVAVAQTRWLPANFEASKESKKPVSFSWISQAIKNLQNEQKKSQKNNPFAPTSASLVNVGLELDTLRSVTD